MELECTSFTPREFRVNGESNKFECLHETSCLMKRKSIIENFGVLGATVIDLKELPRPRQSVCVCVCACVCVCVLRCMCLCYCLSTCLCV